MIRIMLLLLHYFFFFFNCSDLASIFVLAFDSEVFFQVLIFLLSHGVLDLKKKTQKSISIESVSYPIHVTCT